MTTPNDPTRGMHRANGHDTSRAAALSVLGKRSALQQIVLAKFLEAGPRGLTLYELEALCNDHRSTMRTRCSELVDQGLIIDTKEKRRVNGRLRKVWRIPTPADDTDGDLVDLMHGGRIDPLQALLGREFTSEFRDHAEIEAYIRANGFRLVGEESGTRIYKTVKGHRFSFAVAQGPILGRLSWEAPQRNTTLPPAANPQPTLTNPGSESVN